MGNMEMGPMIFGGLITFVSVLFSAYWAYRFALKKLKEETPLLIQRDMQNKEIDALQNFWKLLQYTTDNENEKSIFIFEKKEDKKIWYIIPENGRKFRQAVSDFFYGQGAGLFISRELKALLFEYDRQLFGLLLSTSNSPEDKIRVKSERLIRRLMDIHNQLLELLKQEKENVMNTK